MPAKVAVHVEDDGGDDGAEMLGEAKRAAAGLPVPKLQVVAPDQNGGEVMRGYCGIGISHGKTAANLGTLWRSAHLLGASFLFTVGARYRKQSSDTMRSWRMVPLWHFTTLAQLRESLPRECLLVGVELDDRAHRIETFTHPERAIYLLGAEDHGLTTEERTACHHLIQLPGDRSMNVAAAGTVVLYDRFVKRGV